RSSRTSPRSRPRCRRCCWTLPPARSSCTARSVCPRNSPSASGSSRATTWDWPTAQRRSTRWVWPVSCCATPNLTTVCSRATTCRDSRTSRAASSLLSWQVSRTDVRPTGGAGTTCSGPTRGRSAVGGDHEGRRARQAVGDGDDGPLRTGDLALACPAGHLVRGFGQLGHAVQASFGEAATTGVERELAGGPCVAGVDESGGLAATAEAEAFEPGIGEDRETVVELRDVDVVATHPRSVPQPVAGRCGAGENILQRHRDACGTDVIARGVPGDQRGRVTEVARAVGAGEYDSDGTVDR